MSQTYRHLAISGQMRDSSQKSHNDLNLDESRSQRPNFGHESIGHLLGVI